MADEILMTVEVDDRWLLPFGLSFCVVNYITEVKNDGNGISQVGVTVTFYTFDGQFSAYRGFPSRRAFLDSMQAQHAERGQWHDDPMVVGGHPPDPGEEADLWLFPRHRRVLVSTPLSTRMWTLDELQSDLMQVLARVDYHFEWHQAMSVWLDSVMETL